MASGHLFQLFFDVGLLFQSSLHEKATDYFRFLRYLSFQIPCR